MFLQPKTMNTLIWDGQKKHTFLNWCITDGFFGSQKICFNIARGVVLHVACGKCSRHVCFQATLCQTCLFFWKETMVVMFKKECMNQWNLKKKQGIKLVPRKIIPFVKKNTSKWNITKIIWLLGKTLPLSLGLCSHGIVWSFHIAPSWEFALPSWSGSFRQHVSSLNLYIVFVWNLSIVWCAVYCATFLDPNESETMEVVLCGSQAYKKVCNDWIRWQSGFLNSWKQPVLGSTHLPSRRGMEAALVRRQWTPCSIWHLACLKHFVFLLSWFLIWQGLVWFAVWFACWFVFVIPAQALSVNIDGAPTSLYPLALVPRMCEVLGITIEKSMWSRLVEEASRSKQLIEIKEPERSERHELQFEPVPASAPPSASTKRRQSFSENTFSACSSASLREHSTGARSSAPSGGSWETENEELRQENQHLKRRLDAAAKQLAAKKAKIRRLTQFAAKSKSKMKAMKLEKSEMEITKTAANRNLTISGSFAVGLRMALSSASALSFPRAAWVDISRFTVARCEVKVASSVFVRAHIVSHLMFNRMYYSRLLRDGYACLSDEHLQKALQRLRCFKSCKPFVDQLTSGTCDQEDDGEDYMPGNEKNKIVVHGLHSLVGLPPPGPQKKLCVAGLSVQNDATNSEIWHKKKLTSCVVEAGVLIDEEELSKLNYNNAFSTDQFMSLGCKHKHVLVFFQTAVVL